MRRLLVGAALFAGGCTSFVPVDDPFFLFLSNVDPDATDSGFERTCEENFNNADCDDPGTDGPSDWTATSLDDVTGPEGFAQVLSGDKADGARRIVLVWEGSTFDGTLVKTNGVWYVDVMHEAVETDGQRLEHTSGYVFESSETEVTRASFNLTVDAGTGEVGGSWTFETARTIRESESDGYDTGVAFSQIDPAEALDCFAGDCDNGPSAGDCAADPCTFTETTSSWLTGEVSGFVVHPDEAEVWTEAGQSGRTSSPF